MISAPTSALAVVAVAAVVAANVHQEIHVGEIPGSLLMVQQRKELGDSRMVALLEAM
jgi:hypothetical protein